MHFWSSFYNSLCIHSNTCSAESTPSSNLLAQISHVLSGAAHRQSKSTSGRPDLNWVRSWTSPKTLWEELHSGETQAFEGSRTLGNCCALEPVLKDHAYLFNNERITVCNMRAFDVHQLLLCVNRRFSTMSSLYWQKWQTWVAGESYSSSPKAWKN